MSTTKTDQTNFLILMIALSAITAPFTAFAGDCLNASFSGGARFKTTGDPTLDATFNNEASQLSTAFGVTPDLYTLDDSQSANAFANCSDNTVSFGLRLLREQLWQMDKGPLAIAGIMAHEFTHILQCSEGTLLTGKNRELQADYVAGWYLRNNKSVYGLDVSDFARSVWSMGDYNFRDPQHHGTPTERVAAFAAGFKDTSYSASTALSNGEQFLTGGGGGYPNSRSWEDLSSSSTKTTRSCTRQVACTHLVACQHIVACTHPVMTPYGLMAMHAGDIVHPGGDFVHSYDVETYSCSE